MYIKKCLTIDVIAAILIAGVFYSCHQNSEKNSAKDFEKQLSDKFRFAKKGDVIEIPEGKFEITGSLSLYAIPFVTIRGMAQSKTVLSFRNQTEGTDGLDFINANNLVIENISIHDVKGDGIKIQDSKGVTIRNVAVGWLDGPKTINGRYGVNLVSCSNVLVEKCAITAASDAGIFASQCENVIIRENMTYENVAGIEVENCFYADVINNKTYNNSVGIFALDLPGLLKRNGHHLRVLENSLKDNNFPNFASKENYANMVPSGTGLLLMSTRDVEVFKNEISGHHTVSAAVISFLLTHETYQDSLYNPFSSSIFIHNNVFKQEAASPDTSRPLGKLANDLFGGKTINILFDGFIDTAFVDKNGKVWESHNLCLRNNGEIKFVNINAPSDFKKILTDPRVHDCEQGEIPAVEF